MNKLRKNLYVGNFRDATLIPQLRKSNITTVLNVAYELDDPVYHPQEIRYVKIGLLDSTENKMSMKKLAVNSLITLLEAGETVLIHCAAGLSRAPFVASQALSKMENKDPEDILQEIRNSRPFAMKGGLWLDYESYKPIGYEEK